MDNESNPNDEIVIKGTDPSDGSPITQSNEDELVLCVYNCGQSRLLAPKVCFDDGQTLLVGWVGLGAYIIIFHSFYAVGPIVLQCSHKLYQLENIVKIYEALSTDERVHVPCTS